MANLLTVNQVSSNHCFYDKKWFVMDNTCGIDGKPIGRISAYFHYRKNAIIRMATLCKEKEYTNI